MLIININWLGIIEKAEGLKRTSGKLLNFIVWQQSKVISMPNLAWVGYTETEKVLREIVKKVLSGI